jgi:hypothetical protein
MTKMMLDKVREPPPKTKEVPYWLQCAHARMADRAATHKLKVAQERKAETAQRIRELGLAPED